MKNLFPALRSRMALIAVGAILFGGIGAGLVMLTTLYLSPESSFGTQALANNGGTSSTSTTPTTTPTGTVIELRGAVQSIAPGGGSFVMNLSDGSSMTVVITAQTRFRGEDNASVAGVQVGMQVSVRGVMQSDGTVNALMIHAGDG